MSESNSTIDSQKQKPPISLLKPEMNSLKPHMSGGEPNGAPAEPRKEEPEWKVPGNDSVPGVENVPSPPETEPVSTPERRWL